jgi:hypothetical protein
MAMERNFFEEAVAHSRVGRRIRSLIEVSGVPKGTTGQVVRIDEIESTSMW